MLRFFSSCLCPEAAAVRSHSLQIGGFFPSSTSRPGDRIAGAACCRSSVFVFVVRFLNAVVSSAGHRTRTRRARSNRSLQLSFCSLVAGDVARLCVCVYGCVCVLCCVGEFHFFFLTKVNFSVANCLLQNIPVVFLFVCLSCREKDGVKNLSSRLYSGVSFNLVFLLYCGNEGAGFCFFLCINLDRFFWMLSLGC